MVYARRKASSTKRCVQNIVPASALARKGAYEVRQLARELNLTLTVTGKTLENAEFWKDVNIQIAGVNLFENIGLVIIPTYIEHQPRLILKALALNIPVITTPACGITERENLNIIPAGDYDAFKAAVLKLIL
ncbi:MAG: hypothetical protein JWP37_2864 [Mucilaginibacter sp.]|nr:hypothetical protein [Mucilaginibacter sp.]